MKHKVPVYGTWSSFTVLPYHCVDWNVGVRLFKNHVWNMFPNIGELMRPIMLYNLDKDSVTLLNISPSYFGVVVLFLF